MADMTLEQEQAAFDAQLEKLLAEHKGEFVLFKDGKPVQFFKRHEDAYAAGLDLYGLDRFFLVAPIEHPDPGPVSISWEAGVLFG